MFKNLLMILAVYSSYCGCERDVSGHEKQIKMCINIGIVSK